VHNRIRVSAVTGGPVTSDNCRIERLQP